MPKNQQKMLRGATGALFLALLVVDPGRRLPPVAAQLAIQATTSGAEDAAALLEAKAAADTSACACTSSNRCQTDACPLDSWTPDTEPCGEGFDDEFRGWVGVICDASGGRVVGVLLYDTGVGGELLPFFGRLGALLYLRLYVNPTLSGDVADLAGATELKELRLQGCPLVVGEVAALAALVHLGEEGLFPPSNTVSPANVFLAGTGVRGPVAALRALPGLSADWGPEHGSWYGGADFSPCSAFGGQQACTGAPWCGGDSNGNTWGTGSPGCAAAGLAPVEVSRRTRRVLLLY